MSRVGIRVAKLGIPGSSERVFADCLAACRAIETERLDVKPACAGRTVPEDIVPILEIAQKTGLAVEIYAFVGSSPIRALAEGWDLDLVEKRTAEAIDLGVRAGLPVAFVTEDTTRSRPDVLARLFRVAIDHGAGRLCLCDTVGHATPDGAEALIRFTQSVVASLGATVGIDWHGHNDRGLALDNALRAMHAGADRVHATALGIGERVGNAAMELVLLNLKLLGVLEDQDLSGLVDYCETAARALDWQIPINHPLVGRDAFRTATGVHAAAIAKAQSKGDAWLADRVYSGVPAGAFGRRQEICVGSMSGASNVAHWLRSHGIEPTGVLVRAVLEKAKESDTILSEEAIMAVAASVRRAASDED